MRRSLLLFLVCVVLVLLMASWAWAEDPSPSILSFEVRGGGQDLSPILRIFFLLTFLTFLPALLLCLTSFTRILVVLSLLRQAIGLVQMPPNQVLIGLALILTFFTMAPVWDRIHQEAVLPYMEHRLSMEEAVQKAVPPLRDFLLRQTREKDIALFVNLSHAQRPRTPADLPMRILVPAFIISELKAAFQIGFLLYVPFLVIDMVVASVLLSMGMFMLPPVMVSLPFKLMLFVLVDGWYLIVGSLMKSFA